MDKSEDYRLGRRVVPELYKLSIDADIIVE